MARVFNIYTSKEASNENKTDKRMSMTFSKNSTTKVKSRREETIPRLTTKVDRNMFKDQEDQQDKMTV